MIPFATARDISLSIWQSAVKAATESMTHHTVAARAAGTASIGESAEAVDAGRLNLATAAYVATADPRDTSTNMEAVRASGFTAEAAPGGSLMQEAELSMLSHQLAEAIVENNTMKQQLLKKQIKDHPAVSAFDWMQAVIEYVNYYKKLKGEPHYRSWKTEGNNDLDYSLVEWKLPSNGRVAIIADWGTGRTEAINVLRAACSLHPTAIIHLGDIYFSGLPKECDDNFLEIVRTYAVDAHGSPIPVFSLAGNHDYYSGGGGFLGLIDQLNDGGRKQDASYFCLRSEDGGWQFLAADTGYNDHIFSLKRLSNATGPHLRDDEIEWHHHKLTDQRFSGRTILLSHHQAFSANEKIGDPDGHDGDSINQRLIGAFDGHLDNIPLWLWGHEHVLMIFDAYQNIQRGRCIGHGAVPMSANKDPYSNPKYGQVPFNRDAQLGTKGQWYNHGFAFITLHGKGNPLDAIYYQVVDEATEVGYSMISLHREQVA
jgi:hypothetical protein